ncbi:MAG: ribonuclease E/G [Pseudomonadota bacterium]
MKGRVVALDLTGRRARAALMVDGRLEDLVTAPADPDAPTHGRLYRAQVIRKPGKLGGAFLDLDGTHHGFLRDASTVREGARLTVQVASLAEPGKAVPVTPNLLVKGAFAILTPGRPGTNVSRALKDGERRAALAEAAEAAMSEARDRGMIPGDTGAIVRTAADAVPPACVAAEIAALAERWDIAADRAAALDTARATGTVGGWTAAYAALIDWAAPLPDVVRVRAEGPDAVETVAALIPDRAWAARIEDAGRRDPFDEFGLWEAVDALARPSVPLPSGGRLVIEPTTALVAADVNTGQDLSSAAGPTANVEAARVLVRELRLRGLGGQVVVDFAPMAKKERRRVEEALRAALKRDPIETVAHGWTTLGLFELQRKRERPPL